MTGYRLRLASLATVAILGICQFHSVYAAEFGRTEAPSPRTSESTSQPLSTVVAATEPSGRGGNAAYPVGIETVREIIYERAHHYGVSYYMVIEIANCESSLNPYAVGKYGELGLFQLYSGGLLDEFYAEGYQDVWSTWSQTDFFIRKWLEGKQYNWSCFGILYGEY